MEKKVKRGILLGVIGFIFIMALFLGLKITGNAIFSFSPLVLYSFEGQGRGTLKIGYYADGCTSSSGVRSVPSRLMRDGGFRAFLEGQHERMYGEYNNFIIEQFIKDNSL